jgi:dTDP-4-dehydrorhamnose reductase
VKVLILGANGMLGHKLYQTLMPVADVVGTIRGIYSDFGRYGFFTESTIVPEINFSDSSYFDAVITQIKPDILVNCIGIVKQLKEANNRMLSIEINSLLPHKLYQICRSKGIRLIHISTDCVFSGKKGYYREDDISDAEDIYGKTKYLGEIAEDDALTIRTSIIGRELSTSNGLVEWLITNRDKQVNGYTNAIFSGFPTLHLAGIIRTIILNYPELSGLYHISSDPINKYRLLALINQKLSLNVNILKYPDFYCDRSLDSTSFRKITGFKPLTWEKMLDEFAEDAKQYKFWRK